MENDPLTEKIIGICFLVHRELGPGFLEKIYHQAIVKTLIKENIKFECEKEFPVFFQEERVGVFRVDLFIEDKLIIEIKAVVGYTPIVFRNQLISYLKASNMKTGLLINFGNKSCEVKRISN